MTYVKCPRCSLNYIQEHEVLCKVCLVEVGKALKSRDDDEEDYDICPECGDNVIKTGEYMCYQCLMERTSDDIDVSEPVKNKEWEAFLPAEADEEPAEEDEEENEEKEEEEEFSLEKIGITEIEQDEAESDAESDK